MNKQESDILNTLLLEPFINQRILAEVSGHSLGVVNRSLKELIKDDYLDESIRPTIKAITEFKQKTPQRAVILAAGFGMRMVPINTEMPKGLLEVNGEALIERIIKQLHEVGIKEIYVVVGFMKEKYEYLIDEYGVELIVNADYAAKNNLHSVKLVKEHLENAYIIPCDIWCDRNPFHRHELYSWYMVSDLVDEESDVRVNRKMELVRTIQTAGNAMIGISYLTAEHAGQPDKNGQYRILSTMEKQPPKVVCSETYLVAGAFDTEAEADNYMRYLKTRFVRFLISILAMTQHISKGMFGFVPVQDFSRAWTDEELFSKYKLTSDEVAFIQSIIKEMA